MRRAGLPVYAAGAFLFLYLPLAVLALFSFNSSRFTVWEGFSLQWYSAAFHDVQLTEAAWNSFLIAVAATILSTTIGTCALMVCGGATPQFYRDRCIFRLLLPRSSVAFRC